MLMTPAVTGGCEPVYMFAYVKKNILGGMVLDYNCNYLLEEALRRRRLFNPDILAKITHFGTIQHIDEIPEDIKRVFRCAHDISPEWHVKIQARFQKYVENSISKTCNFPNSATPDDIMIAYITAWEQGCKGLTVYRDGSRNVQVLESAGEHKRKLDDEKAKRQMASSFDQGLLPDKPVTPPLKIEGLDQDLSTTTANDSTTHEEKPAKRYKPVRRSTDDNCPDCRTEAHVIKAEGCASCTQCGWSKCN